MSPEHTIVNLRSLRGASSEPKDIVVFCDYPRHGLR